MGAILHTFSEVRFSEQCEECTSECPLKGALLAAAEKSNNFLGNALNQDSLAAALSGDDETASIFAEAADRQGNISELPLFLGTRIENMTAGQTVRLNVYSVILRGAMTRQGFPMAHSELVAGHEVATFDCSTNGNGSLTIKDWHFSERTKGGGYGFV